MERDDHQGMDSLHMKQFIIFRMRFPDGFKRFNDDIAVVLELAHPQAECLQRDILQLVDLGNHVIGTPFVSIARGDGIFADVVFENIRPVRFILFPEKTQDDIDRFGEFFLIAQYLQTFQEDLFILELALDTLADDFFFYDVIGDAEQ